jgi:hypothetical protein
VLLAADAIVRRTYAGHVTDDALDDFVVAIRSGTYAPEPDPQLRLVTTVAREHVLHVEEGDGDLVLRSKRLRCDESYCGNAALDALASVEGVLSIDRFTGDDPPRVIVRYDAATNAERIISALVALLGEDPDPLYERPLEIVWD